MKGALYFIVSNSAWVKDRLAWEVNNLKTSLGEWVWGMGETVCFSRVTQGHRVLLLGVIF